MKSVHNWLDEYGESHQNKTNKIIKTIKEDHSLLLDKTAPQKDPKDKKPKPILS